MKQRVLASLVVGAVFLLQLGRGLVPNAEPWVVAFSAAMSALVAWGVFRGLLALWDRWKRR